MTALAWFLLPIAVLGMAGLIISIIAFPCEICGSGGHSTTSHEADDYRKELRDRDET